MLRAHLMAEAIYNSSFQASHLKKGTWVQQCGLEHHRFEPRCVLRRGPVSGGPVIINLCIVTYSQDMIELLALD